MESFFNGRFAKSLVIGAINWFKFVDSIDEHQDASAYKEKFALQAKKVTNMVVRGFFFFFFHSKKMITKMQRSSDSASKAAGKLRDAVSREKSNKSFQKKKKKKKIFKKKKKPIIIKCSRPNEQILAMAMAVVLLALKNPSVKSDSAPTPSSPSN